MVRLPFRLFPINAEPATVSIAPDDPVFEVTDFAGTVSRNSTRIRLTRTINDTTGGYTSNLRAAAPGARVRFNVTLASMGEVVIEVYYNGLIVLNSVYNDASSIYVDGEFFTQFFCPVPWAGPGNNPPVSAATVSVVLPAGEHLIEVIFPYDAGMDFTGVDIPATASIGSPTARTTLRYAFGGDSRYQGFNATDVRYVWPFLICADDDAQMLNLAYGGRQVEASDGTVLGALGCDRTFYMADFNDFAPGGNSIPTFKATYKTLLTNFRAAAISAGRPDAELIVMTSYYSDAFPLNSPTLAQFRQAERDAVSEVADPHVLQLEGTHAGMPDATSPYVTSGDGIHYLDPDNAQALPVIEAQI